MSLRHNDLEQLFVYCNNEVQIRLDWISIYMYLHRVRYTIVMTNYNIGSNYTSVSQCVIRPSLYLSSIVKSRSNLFLEATSSNQ